MAEMIPVDDNQPAFVFLCEAIGLASNEIRPAVWKTIQPGSPVEVEFKVNGVVIPFAKTMRLVCDIRDQEVAKRAAELVRETVALKGLESLQESIRRFDWEVRDKIESLFGVTLDDH